MKKMRDGIYNVAFDSLSKIYRIDDTLTLSYSPHAINEAKNDKYHPVVLLPNKLTIKTRDIVELEIVNGIVCKIIVRKSFNAILDIIYVILLESGIVKTIWLNRKNDNHAGNKNFSYK